MMDDLISRQAAIDEVNNLTYPSSLVDVKRILVDLPSAQPDSGYIEQIKWERDLAIRQLADLGYGLGEKPRPNGDLISRRSAIDAICDNCNTVEANCPHYPCSRYVAVEKLPSAERKGKWIDEPNCWYRCSLCGEHYPSMRGYMYYKFCPNCGADMRGE